MSYTLKQLQQISNKCFFQTCIKYNLSVNNTNSKEELIKILIGIKPEQQLNVNKIILKNRCKELNKKSSGNVNELIYNLMNVNIQNMGTGAGGANTNKTGLTYEKITDLSDKYNVINSKMYKKNNKSVASSLIKFHGYDSEYIKLNKRNLFNFMKMNNKLNTDIHQAHGCKQPDECYINEDNKVIIIIEKKFQQCSGSVCEKLQTADFKKIHYSKLFPEYKIEYIYCLSNWFRINCIAELEYLQLKKIPVFWGNDNNYKNIIIDFIVNCK